MASHSELVAAVLERRRSGVTQAEMAEQMGMSGPVLSSWMNGQGDKHYRGMSMDGRVSAYLASGAVAATPSAAPMQPAYSERRPLNAGSMTSRRS